MTATTIGAGSDKLTLGMTEDAYQGDAQFTISVDDQQVGGTLTATSPHGGPLQDTVDVLGDWAAGPHTVTVNFLIDAYDGTPDTDRNLYVDGATYDGAPVNGAARVLYPAGPVSFGFTDGTPLPAATGPATVGSGSDALVLKVSGDAYQGNAQFTVSVDGQQVGDVLTASALHGSGASDTVDVLGNWAAGPHTVTVNFLNDAYDGTPDTDRNLYVDGATYDGAPVSGAAQVLYSTGPASFGATDPGTTVTWSNGTTEASLLHPTLNPGDTLIVKSNATVVAEGNQLAGVAVDLLGTGSSAKASLTLFDATVGSLSLTSVGSSDQAELYSSKLGHLDVFGHAAVAGSTAIGEGRPLGTGSLDATLHGSDSVLTLHGASIQSSSALTINGDQGSTVENDGNIRIVGGYVTGSVNIQANLQGTGTISGGGDVAGDAASIRLGGDVGAGQTIDLSQTNLQLDQPPRFAGTLAGFNSGRDSGVTLAHETAAGTSFQQSSSSNGDLSVFTQDQNTGAAGATLVLHVAGNFASDAFAYTNNATAQSTTITLAS
jgi:hypothetical protein